MSMHVDPTFGEESQEYFDDDDFHDYDESLGDYQDSDDERDIDFDDFIDNYE